MGGTILAIIVVIIINIAVSSFLARCAEEKGYTGSNYFWVCFFLGVAGYCIVAALPDMVLHDKISTLLHQNNNKNIPANGISGNTQRTVNTQPANGGWRCTCGREHPAYVSTCVCGVNRSQIK